MKKITQVIIIESDGEEYRVRGNGSRYLLQLGVGAFMRGEIEPTFGQKLRRFFRRLRREIGAGLDEAAAHIIGRYCGPEPRAEDIPLIGRIE